MLAIERFWRPGRQASLVLLTCAVFASAAAASELVLLRTIGGDDDDVLIHRPERVVFGPDGSAYVLNGGDCRILRFDRDWNCIGVFAQCGQGPGEFENATGMILHQDMVWIFETAQATLFDLAGQYLETRRGQMLLQGPVVRGEDIICRLDGSDRAACRVNDKLELIQKLGPACPTDDFFERYKRCGFMHLLSHPDYVCLLINPIDGALHAVGDDGEVVRTVSLMDREGRSEAAREDDSVSMSFTLVLGKGFVDAAGRLWTLPLPPEEEEEQDEEKPQIVVVRDRGFEKIAEFTLPRDVKGYDLAPTPGGDLVLLDARESLIHVLESPDLPARE
jgi:hypothetical protein